MNKEIRQKIAQQVASFYQEQGQLFSSKRGRSWNLMDLIKQRVNKGDVLVDIGAGNGRLIEVLPQDVQYLGIEPSDSLREQARIKYSNKLNFKIIPGSLPKIDLPKDTADVVACIAVLHHVPSREWRREALQELYRILKPGGLLVCTVWNLRAKRFLSWHTFKYAWLRLKGVVGGEAGDLYYSWKAGDNIEKRYVHAYTLSEYKGDFSTKDWEIERIDAFDLNGWCNWFNGRNLIAVVRKK